MNNSKVFYYNKLDKEIVPLIADSEIPEGITRFYLPDTIFIQPGAYEIGEDQNFLLTRDGTYEITQVVDGVEQTALYCVFGLLSVEVVLEHILRKIDYHSRADRAKIKENFLQALPVTRDCLPLDLVNVVMNALNYPIRYLHMYSKSKNKVVNTFIEAWLGVHEIEKWQMFDIDSGFKFSTKQFVDLITCKNNASEVLAEALRIAKDNHPLDFPRYEEFQKNYLLMADLLADDDIVLVYIPTPDTVHIFTEDEALLALKDPPWLKDSEEIFAGKNLQYNSMQQLNYELYEKKAIYVYASKIVETNTSSADEES